jgi:hypothetical protein
VAGRWAVRIVALVAILLLGARSTPPLAAAELVEIRPLGRDASGQYERYRVTLLPGATLWDLAYHYLPLVSLEQSEAQAYQLVAEGFQQTFPDRKPDAVKPEDSFTLEVPLGTFVTRQFTREGSIYHYQSFAGDQLTYYARHPTLVSRLIRHEAPNRAEVSLTGDASSVVELTREIYEVDQPDFLQVRMVRGALSDNKARVVVNLNKKYLDDFRNYRERAVRTEPGEAGRTVYTFAPDDADNPFLRVEDAIGNEADPAAFPRDLRLAFYRDGSVRRLLLTETGDAISQLNQPDTGRWQQHLPEIKGWQPGTVEALAPFTPPVNQAGQLIPGRLLVLHFAPRVAATPTPASPPPAAGSSGGGLTCLGVPLAVLLSGLVTLLRQKLPLLA